MNSCSVRETILLEGVDTKGGVDPMWGINPMREGVDPMGGVVSMRVFDPKEGVDPMGGVIPFVEGLILKSMNVLKDGQHWRNC